MLGVYKEERNDKKCNYWISIEIEYFNENSNNMDKIKQNLIRYKALGIELGFDSNRLTEIAIFKP